MGNLLILIGVLAWLPYYFLLSQGGTPSILPFLAVHLAGVLSGGWLRSREMDTRSEHGRSRKIIARILIILGILAWAPYYYLTIIQGVDQSITPFLIAHLVGVLGGSAVRLSLEAEKILRRD